MTTTSSPSTSDTVSTLSETDRATIRARHADFVFGFDKEPDAGHWDFRAVQGEHFPWDFEGGRYYDDMDPEHRVARSAADYQRIWEPTFNELLEATHRIEEGPEILGAGDLASSRLVFVARLVTADGSVVDIRTHNSLTLFRFTEGWKIVGDHTSSQFLDAEETDRLLASLPGAETFV